MAEDMDLDGTGSEQAGSAPAVSSEASGSTPSGVVLDAPIAIEDNEAVGALPTAFKDPIATAGPPLNGHTTTAGSALATLTKKRKPLSDGAGSDRAESARSRGSVKRAKLAEVLTASPLPLDKSLLSPEIWHHIFAFCPPKSLGNLLAVNKLFNLYLEPGPSVTREVPVSVTGPALRPLKANAIWQVSRRLFWPHMPAPFRSMTELDMWRLACSPRCQDCKKPAIRVQSDTPDPRHPGPGPEGVAAIWAFAARMCATCLLKNSVKVRGQLEQREKAMIEIDI